MCLPIFEVFPEVMWIQDEALRIKVANTFLTGLDYGSLTIENLRSMPYTASYATQITYQQHVRLVTKIALSMYDACSETLEIHGESLGKRDYLIAGALLHDVGKLLELKIDDQGKISKSENGKLLRHAFTGVHFAMENALPDEIVHIIAVHSQEGIASHPTLLAHFVRLADQTAERFSDWDLSQKTVR